MANHPAASNYVNNVWLAHKQKFVACFVDEFLHFGNANTSRAEKPSRNQVVSLRQHSPPFDADKAVGAYAG